ncbi:MAG: 30S ribosomal protein S20 [Kiritimatiellia bacterium]|jgi:small subunit ribosomal protein S20|uniref:30S ribosomal protein S20 n=1 Tax=Atribacter sp. TaxID=2847780 RepID=UPI003D98A544
MPNIKSAIKRARTSEAKRKINNANKSRLNTARRAYADVIATGDDAAKAEAFKIFSSAIDKAAKQGVISQNAAARRKSRAFKKLAPQEA